jgi:hypothetical protein
LGHLNYVLFTGVFVSHVVRHGAAFIKILGAACLDVFDFRRWCTLDLVSQNGTAKHANRGTQSVTPNGMADGASSYGAHERTSARLWGLGGHLLLCANLAWHSHLLDDGYRGNDAADLLGL